MRHTVPDGLGYNNAYMGKAILITSGKGGVGKTTVTANLGFALSKRGKKTVVVEGDIGLNNLDVALGIEDKIIYDAGDVVLGKASLSQALIEISENYFALTASTASASFIKAESFKDIIKQLCVMFDYVLVDCPAGIEDSFHRASAGANEAIVVVTPHLASIRDGYKASKLLASYGISPVGLIVNRIRGEYVVNKTSLSPADISQTVKLPCYGVVPEDDVINTIGQLHTYGKRSASAFSYSLIAGYIDGGERKIFDCTAEFKGIFNKLRRFLS